MAKRKIVIQIFTVADIRPMHFCIVDKDLADAFFKETRITYSTLLPKLSRWSYEDFGIAPDGPSARSVREYKDKLIRAMHDRFSDTPEQLLVKNLLSFWVSEHMKKEIDYYEP